MRTRLTGGICALVLAALAGCSSGGGSSVDAWKETRIKDAALIDFEVGPSSGPDAGCDDSAAGLHQCIINPPGQAQGGGTLILRTNPVPYQSCRAQ